MPSELGLWAKAVSKIAEVVGNWQVSKERNRLMYRVEAAMDYVFVNEKTGEYQDANEDRQKKLFLHFRKRIFDAS